MSVKVFIVGRPGSGKSSAAACFMKMLANLEHWFTEYISDYNLLQKMFLQEQDQKPHSEKRRFCPTGPEECNGFDVIDFSVLDTVLKEIEKKVRENERVASAEEKLFLIEFARNDYTHALQQFDPEFLQGTYFLYLNVDVETCVERIHRRITCPMISQGDFIPDNIFVSDNIMRTYYREDDWSRISVSLKLNQDLGVHVEEISNSGSPQDLPKLIEQSFGSRFKKGYEGQEQPVKDEEPISISSEPFELHDAELVKA